MVWKKNFTIKHCVYWKRNWKKNTFTNLVFLIQYFFYCTIASMYFISLRFGFEKLKLSLAEIHLNFSIVDRCTCKKLQYRSLLLNIAQIQRICLRGLQTAFLYSFVKKCQATYELVKHKPLCNKFSVAKFFARLTFLMWMNSLIAEAFCNREKTF